MLDFDKTFLDYIEVKNQMDLYQSLIDVLDLWLKRADPPPSSSSGNQRKVPPPVDIEGVCAYYLSLYMYTANTFIHLMYILACPFSVFSTSHCNLIVYNFYVTSVPQAPTCGMLNCVFSYPTHN